MNLKTYINNITTLSNQSGITTVPPVTEGDFFSVCDTLAPLPQSVRGLVPASPSSVDKMITCPRQFDAAYIGHGVKKVPFKQNKYAIRGDVAHAVSEKWLLGEGNNLISFTDLLNRERLSRYSKEQHIISLNDLHFANGEWWFNELNRLKKLSGITTEINRGWNDVTGSGAWRGRKIGAKSDFTARVNDNSLFYCDFKTGKVRDKPFQLEMTAYILMKLDTDVETVITEYLFLDYQQRIRYIYNRNRPYALRQETNGFSVHPLFYPQWMGQYWENQKSLNYPGNKCGLCGQWCQVIDCPENGNYKGEMK